MRRVSSIRCYSSSRPLRPSDWIEPTDVVRNTRVFYPVAFQCGRVEIPSSSRKSAPGGCPKGCREHQNNRPTSVLLVLKLKFLHEARSVGENIDFGRFENANAGRTPVQALDERDLFPKVFDRHAARDLETLRVIRDADIFIAMLLRGSRHLLDRMRPSLDVECA